TVVNNLAEGVYTFELIVTDNKGVSAAATLTVTVKPALPSDQAPVAVAGPPQEVVAPVPSLALDGSASYDPDGTIVKYSWVQASGGVGTTLVNSNTMKPTVYGLQPGVYVFRLTVTDNLGATGSDQVTITVKVAPPAGSYETVVAEAGKDTTITFPNSTAVLDGTGSYVQGGTIVSYAWTQVSGPSTAAMSNPFESITNLTQLVVGDYVFKLTVTGDQNVISTATVRVHVKSDLRTSPNGGNTKIFPNPVVQNTVTVTAMNSARGKVMISLRDVHGRMIQEFEFDKQDDIFSEQLNLVSISKGVYFLSVRFEGLNKPVNFRLVKQ
ncbi:MAG TPA: PKD domain-containing protein, partial [Puia sp.]|nr:PKD domain-containing protein [Puia sp.]